MFTAANFPGAAAADLTNARASVRISDRARDVDHSQRGRWTQTGTTSTWAGRFDKFHLSEGGGFIQDQWRLSSALTLNGGLRYQVQLPPTPEIAQLLQGAMSRRCAASPGRDGGSARAATCSCRARSPEVLLSTRSSRPAPRVRARTGTTGRQTSASPGARMCKADSCECCSGDPVAGDDPRQLWHVVRSRDARDLSERVPGESGPDVLGDAQRRERQPRAARPDLAGAVQRHEPARRAGDLHRRDYRGVLSGDAGIPLTATTANNMSVFDPHLQEPSNRQYSPWPPARDVEGHGARSPLRRHAKFRRNQYSQPERNHGRSRTGFSTSSSSRKRTCTRTSRPAEGRRSRTSVRARARRRCRSSWPASTASRSHRRATRAATRARTGRTRRSRDS